MLGEASLVDQDDEHKHDDRSEGNEHPSDGRRPLLFFSLYERLDVLLGRLGELFAALRELGRHRELEGTAFELLVLLLVLITIG